MVTCEIVKFSMRGAVLSVNINLHKMFQIIHARHASRNFVTFRSKSYMLAVAESFEVENLHCSSDAEPDI